MLIYKTATLVAQQTYGNLSDWKLFMKLRIKDAFRLFFCTSLLLNLSASTQEIEQDSVRADSIALTLFQKGVEQLDKDSSLYRYCTQSPNNRPCKEILRLLTCLAKGPEKESYAVLLDRAVADNASIEDRENLLGHERCCDHVHAWRGRNRHFAYIAPRRNAEKILKEKNCDVETSRKEEGRLIEIIQNLENEYCQKEQQQLREEERQAEIDAFMAMSL